MAPKPLLLLDVDGVLNPWTKITRKGHQAGDDYTKHVFHELGEFPDGLAVLLADSHGPALRSLADDFTLVWATTWEEDANKYVSPLLGLPTDVPVIHWPDHARDKQHREGRNGSWKTPWIARWLADFAPGLAWAWVDDEINRYDRKWFKQWYLTRAAPPHLLIRVEHRHALRPADFTQLHHWADALKNEPASE